MRRASSSLPSAALPQTADVAGRFSWRMRARGRTTLRGDGVHEDVLRGILEMSEAEIRQLYLDKIIVRDPSLEDEVSPGQVRRASG